MYIVSVIPISRGILREELSYFTSQKLALGSLVTVPLRFRKVPAIVTHIEDASAQKASLRSRSYSVRKLESVETSGLLSEVFMSVAHTLAEYYVTTPGAILDILVPRVVLDIEAPHTRQKKVHGDFKQFVLQDTKWGRIIHYKKCIEENKKQGKSVFIVTPTTKRAEELFQALSEETDVFLLHGKQTKKKIRTVWQEILSHENPVTLICTGHFISLPRHDIGSFIIDFERSSAYKTFTRPFLDMRTAVTTLAKDLGATCVYADTLLRTETWHAHKEGTMPSYTTASVSYKAKPFEVVDMRRDKESEKKAQLFSPQLLSLIRESQNVFLFVARRGLAPISVCDDCGTTKLCNKCGAPVTLHTENNDRIFVCHHCGQRTSSAEKCTHCDSWRITTLGIGTELVEEKIKKTFPERSVMRLDSDTATSQKALTEIIERWHKDKNAILIGTELSLPHLKNESTVAVVSLDALFAIPDFRIDERIFGLLIELQTSTNLSLIQTRNPDNHLLSFIQKGGIEEFYKHELEARKTFDYPPFTTLIKLSTSGKNAEAVLKKVQNDLQNIPADIFKRFQSTLRPTYNALLTLKGWPDKNIMPYLKKLPPEIAVDVDPQNLL